MVKCPECSEEYKSLGKHWYYSPSHRPELTQKQLEITAGLLMGDGHINKRKENSLLKTQMVNKKYLEYIDNIFGCLSTGVCLKEKAVDRAKKNRDSGFHPNAKEENYSDIYMWNSRVHPKFNEFRDWYASGEKVWPEEIKLTPTVLKHWYVGDGNYDNSGSNNSMSIAMNNEVENTEKVSQYFTNIGLPEPSNYNIRDGEYGKSCEARWTKEDSYTLWDYMGEPLPDFEYKWPEEYR
jgi:hypothetical protein